MTMRTIFSLCLLLLLLAVAATTTAAVQRRGMYVNVYKDYSSNGYPAALSYIIGNEYKETLLLEYCIGNGINALTMYGLYGVFSSYPTELRAFILRGRTSYGILSFEVAVTTR